MTVTFLLTTMLILLIATVLAWIGVGINRRFAVRRRMLDIPNERSSHKVPTPRGGGLSIVILVLVGAWLMALTRHLDWSVVNALWAGALVAGVGFLDDQRGVSPLIRGIVHLLSASAGLALLGGMPPLDLGFTSWHWGWLGHIIGVIGIVWFINLYNFMDGIDGLAASESTFVFGVGAVFVSLAGLTDLALVCVLFVGASLGFLRWNWPTARIFMGDVASGFLGYSIAIMAIASSSRGITLTVWLITAAVFVADATVTLLRRAARGERWYQPHRSHAYQHLAVFWDSHQKVTVGILAINAFWLLPLAAAAFFWHDFSLALTVIALIPLALAAVALGAGQRQSRLASHRAIQSSSSGN